jgi:hypothetical protein
VPCQLRSQQLLPERQRVLPHFVLNYVSCYRLIFKIKNIVNKNKTMGAKHTGPASNSELSFVVDYPANPGKSVVTYYINLDHRADRRQEIESELDRMKLGPYNRFSAIRHKKGTIGCTMSHIECMKLGLESGADHILIFEDDFYFTVPPSTLHHVLQEVMKTNYDVFLLGYCLYANKESCIRNTNLDMFKKINQACCTHGYMVNKKYAAKLLRNFEQGLQLLSIGKKDYTIDGHWKVLQDDDLWLCYKEPCGLQREGFSDIENKVKWDLTAIQESLGR